jgi:hypothetical protein
MPVETADDRAILLNDFGVDATYTHNGDSSEIKGILDNEFEEVEIGGSVPFAMQRPRFHCRTNDVIDAVNGDTLVIGGITYYVRVVMPDGTGMTEIQLEKG